MKSIINNRVKRLEADKFGEEPEIIFFRTVYENQDGSEKSISLRAFVASGPIAGRYFFPLDDEAIEDFRIRIRSIANRRTSVGNSPK